MASAVSATLCWREGDARAAMQMTALFAFFLANAVSFLHTTRRGKFVEWARILDGLRLRGDEVVADIRATAAYADALRKLGATNVERRRLGWRFWWGNPFAATTLLTASKPEA